MSVTVYKKATFIRDDRAVFGSDSGITPNTRPATKPACFFYTNYDLLT